MMGFAGSTYPASSGVIPGCATWRRPGIHTPGRGYGFRAHRFAMPRNDSLASGSRLRVNPNLLKRINVILPVQSPSQKYFASPVGQIISTNSRHPTPPEGRIAIVTDAGCGCGGRGSVRRATWLQGGLAKGL